MRGLPRTAPWRLAGGLTSFLIPAAVYVASASHEPGAWDTAELQGVPYILGITHPTGFPLYVILGYAWSHVLPFDTIAFRMNAMSAVAMAIAAWAAYAVARRLGAWWPVALLATFWFAFAPDVWSHANRAEAQDLAVTCEALAIYAFVRWMQGDDAKWFAAAGFLLGCGVAAHPNAMWLAPGFVVGCLVARRRPTMRQAAFGAMLALGGLLWYAYLPLRSAYVVAHGLDPTAALSGTAGGIFWNYNDPSTPQGLLRALSGSESEAPHYLLASLNPVHVQQAFWAFVTGVQEQFGAFAVALAAIGLGTAWKRDWRTTLVLCLACTAGLAFSVTYSNEADVGRYRLMALWLVVPLLGAVLPGAPNGIRGAALRGILCLFAAGAAGASLYGQRNFFVHSAGEGGRWVIEAVRPVVPTGAVIVVDGWLDATSLAYGAYADRTLAGRTIVSGWRPEMAGMYRAWARERPVFILTDPHAVTGIAGTAAPVPLDAYHVLFRVLP
ncbi:MAG TPA: DUF2723 domain-containing protein [Candidatus Tumulicola sp.]|jgi:hypothetical protein